MNIPASPSSLALLEAVRARLAQVEAEGPPEGGWPGLPLEVAAEIRWRVAPYALSPVPQPAPTERAGVAA